MRGDGRYSACWHEHTERRWSISRRPANGSKEIAMGSLFVQTSLQSLFPESRMSLPTSQLAKSVSGSREWATSNN